MINKKGVDMWIIGLILAWIALATIVKLIMSENQLVSGLSILGATIAAVFGAVALLIINS